MTPSKRQKAKSKLMGSHQRCWIWGRRAVLEILEAGRWPILELRLDAAMAPARIERARDLASHGDIPVFLDSAERLRQLCHAPEHQGYVAKMAPFPYASAPDILAGLSGRSGPDASGPAPLFAILDAVQDPYNFGAIARSAEALGVEAIFVGSARQADVGSMVVRSSAGAAGRIPIARVDDLEDLASQLRDRGVCLVAASEKADGECRDRDFTRPTAIVLGNEGAGIRPDLLALCDARVRVPQQGAIGSLNVAMAAAILFYEARRQRNALPATPQANA